MQNVNFICANMIEVDTLVENSMDLVSALPTLIVVAAFFGVGYFILRESKSKQNKDQTKDKK